LPYMDYNAVMPFLVYVAFVTALLMAVCADLFLEMSISWSISFFWYWTGLFEWRIQKCLFAFFDSAVVGQDLKKGLMALIELASAPFGCAQVIICLDREVEPEESKTLLKSLRWVGFELVTLDLWANNPNVTSDKWLFLGMEL